MAKAKKAERIVVTVADVDRLGLLLANIADMTKQADAIKDLIKRSGKSAVEGNMFKATVVEAERYVLVAEEVRELLGEKAFDCEKLVKSTSVRVTSR